MNKDKTKILSTIAVAVALFFSVLGILFRSLALFLSYNPETGYFASGASFPLTFWILALSVIPLLVLVSLFFRRYLMAPLWVPSLSILASSALLVLSLLVFVVSSFFEIPRMTDAYLPTLSVFASLFAVVSIFYFGHAIFGLSPKREGILPYLPVGVSLYALLSAIVFYFDKTVAINSPPKNMHMVAFIALSLYALCETRYLLERLKTPLAYVAVSLALFFTGAASIPNLLYSIATNRILALSTIYDFVLFAAFLYLLARLLGMLPYRITSVHPLVTALEAHAEAAEEKCKADAPAPEEQSPEETVKRLAEANAADSALTEGAAAPPRGDAV